MSEAPQRQGPLLPEALHDTWHTATGLLHSVYWASQRTTLADLQKNGVEPISPPPIEGGTPYVELEPPAGMPARSVDPASAVVFPHPFGTGWGTHLAHNVFRARMLHAVSPTDRLITIPNSTPGATIFDFSAHERQTIASGNFEAWSDRVFRTLEALGIERFRVAGYSQGAATGGHLAARAAKSGHFEVGDSGFFDMPNNVQRSVPTLVMDFLATGTHDVALARSRSGIDALTEGKYVPHRVAAALTRQVMHRDNFAFARGLRHATFQGDMEDFLAHSQAGAFLVRAEHSTVTPRKAFEETVDALQAQFPGRVQVELVPASKHGLCENPVLNAILAAKAFRKVTKLDLAA